MSACDTALVRSADLLFGLPLASGDAASGVFAGVSLFAGVLAIGEMSDGVCVSWRNVRDVTASSACNDDVAVVNFAGVSAMRCCDCVSSYNERDVVNSSACAGDFAGVLASGDWMFGNRLS